MTPDVLPYVDEHPVEVRAPRDRVWRALDDYVHTSVGLSDRHPLALVLGTRPRSGFAVAATVPGEQVALEGRHRFSVYRLVFDVADGPGPGTTHPAGHHARSLPRPARPRLPAACHQLARPRRRDHPHAAHDRAPAEAGGQRD